MNGQRIKKKLSERVHRDVTGIVMHRDLFSAYLSRHINDDKLSLQDAVNQYPGAEPFLVEAWKQYQETAKRVGDAESRQSHSPLERFSKKLGKRSQIAARKKAFSKSCAQLLARIPAILLRGVAQIKLLASERQP